MASNRQIQANRLNAQKSTGPKSPEGKKRASQNRTTHGLSSEHVVLASEDRSSFDNLLAILNGEWDPNSETEAFLVETLAYNQWRLLRIGRIEHASLSRKLESGGELSVPMEVEDLSRYEGRSSRAYYRALNMLTKLQEAREKQPQARRPQEEPTAERTGSVGATPNREDPLVMPCRSEPVTKVAAPPTNLPVTETSGSNPFSPGDSPVRHPLPDAA